MTPNTNFILHKLRTASLQARLMVNELDSIGAALNGGLISNEVAVEWACEVAGVDVLGYVPPEIGWMSEAAE